MARMPSNYPSRKMVFLALIVFSGCTVLAISYSRFVNVRDYVAVTKQGLVSFFVAYENASARNGSTAVTTSPPTKKSPLNKSSPSLQKRSTPCPEKPPHHGNGSYFPVSFENITMVELKRKYKPFDESGRFKPPDCHSRNKVAVIVPYRDRERHLWILLNNLIPFLLKQQTEFTIFVVEQSSGTIFNRGLMLNIGFFEARKRDNYTCFVMHDVDSMPEANDNLYRCSKYPVHMSSASSKYNFKSPYSSYTGGTLGFTKEQYEKINGFSNWYFGWGGEDDDIEIRIKHKGMRVERLPYAIGRYQAIPHEPDKGNPPNPNKGKLFVGLTNRIPTDGISTLHYTSQVEHRQLYTWILVHINMTFHEVKIR